MMRTPRLTDGETESENEFKNLSLSTSLDWKGLSFDCAQDNKRSTLNKRFVYID